MNFLMMSKQSVYLLYSEVHHCPVGRCQPSAFSCYDSLLSFTHIHLSRAKYFVSDTIFFPHFISEECEAQPGPVTSSRLHTWQRAEAGAHSGGPTRPRATGAVDVASSCRWRVEIKPQKTVLIHSCILDALKCLGSSPLHHLLSP